MTSESNSVSKHRLIRRSFVALTFVASVFSINVQVVDAQTRPFEYLQFGFVGGTDLIETELQRTWSIPAVAEFSIDTPFYLGNAQISATYLPASSRSNEITDFWALYVGAGLTYPLELGRRFEIVPGFRFGSMYMNFTDELVEFRKQESEMFVGAAIGLSAAVSSSTRIQVSSSILHTFTETPIDVSLFNVGVQYRLQTPSWLKKVLQ